MVANPVPVSSAVKPPLDWSAAWYPVHFVQDLDKARPTRFMLLDQPLVIWWQPRREEWVVLSDRCSHRLAALSEGRITDDGCLECPYHGWAFTETGACDRIPFAPEGSTAHHSDRATIRHYPSRVAQDLLFVYAGEPADAETTPLPTVPPLDEYPGEWVMADTFRDIPYDATTLLENVLDTSHVSFTHHPRVGNRANAKDFALEVTEATPAGFKGFWAEGPRRGKLGSQTTTFLAPNLIWHDIAESPFGQVMTVVYAVPTEKGKCRAIVRLPFRFKSVVPRLVFKFTPRWLNHLNQNGILEDDQIFLHLQERSLAATDLSYSEACYLPTSSDRFVLAYRKWLQNYGEPFPGQPFTPAETDRAALLDRYHAHTVHCQSCQGALRWFRRLQLGGAIAALLLAFGLILGVALQWPVWGLVSVAVASALSLGAWWQLGVLIRRFYEGEYPPTRNYR